MDWLNMLVAHRGFKSPQGENCLRDFKKSLKICKAVELDIRFTKDKRIIIFHDDSFKRIGKEKTLVRDVNYDDIKEIIFFKNNPEWMPPLFIEEFSEQLASQYEMINVEIKADFLTNQEFSQLLEALKTLRAKTKAEIIVSSFDFKILEWIATLPTSDFKKGYLFEKPKDLDMNLVRSFDYINPSYQAVCKRKNKSFFEEVNLAMNIWTFNYQWQVRKIKRLYPEEQIHGWISNNPNLKVS